MSGGGGSWLISSQNRSKHAGDTICKDGGSFGALRSLGLVGVVLREDELNGWGGLVGVVLVVLAQKNNFIVELAGAWRCSAAAGAGAEGGGVL